jgi:hypothetical protein
MSVSIETVGIQLHLMASVFRRKVSTEMIVTYHAILDRHVREESEFVRACEYVLEHEQQFPAPALLLTLSRESSRNRREIGDPWIKDPAGEPMAPLREWLDALASYRGVAWNGNFKDAMERATWEAGVYGCGGGPGKDEGTLSFAKRVADVINSEKSGIDQVGAQDAKPA